MTEQTEMNRPEIIVDTTELNKTIQKQNDQIAELKKLIESQNTPEPTPESLNEAAVPQRTNWRKDYRNALVEALRGRRTFSFSTRSDLEVSAERAVEIAKSVGMPEIKASTVDVKEFQESMPKRVKDSFEEGTIPAITTTNALPDVWAAETERLHVYPNSKFLSVPGMVKWKTDIQGAGTTVEVVTVDKVVGVDVTEGTEPTTQAGTVSKIQIALKTAGCAYYLTEADVEDMVPSTIDALNEGLGTGLAEKLDTDFYTWVSTPASGSNIRGTLTTAALGTVAMSGSILARAMGSLRSGTYEPAFFLCHPQTVTKMMQNQQFYDASQYGTREVIERGAIANYYGVDIVQSTVVTTTGGTYKSLLLSRGAVGGVMKRQPIQRVAYVIESGRNYVRMTARYGGTVLHGDGVFEIDTSDAS